MTTQQLLHTAGLLLIVMCVAVFGATGLANAQNVHALLIILGNDGDIRASVEKNESSMQTLLRQVSENCEVYMTVMKSETETIGKITRMTLSNARSTNITERKQGIITASQIVQWIHDLSPNSEDTILIYYSGHGSMDAVGTHILNFDPEVTNDLVTRDALRNSLKQKEVRLKMLITDTCSNRVQTPPLITHVYAKVQPKERQYTKNLFLEHTGFLDITAASENQYAWGNKEIGGYFTVSLIGSFTAETDENQDQFLSWKEVFDVTRRQTQQLFRETIFLPHNQRKLDEALQTTQTPVSHELPRDLTRYTSTERKRLAPRSAQRKPRNSVNSPTRPRRQTVSVQARPRRQTVSVQARSRSQAAAAQAQARRQAAAAQTQSRRQAAAAQTQARRQAAAAQAQSRRQAAAAQAQSRRQAAAAQAQSRRQAAAAQAQSRRQAAAAQTQSRRQAAAAQTQARRQAAAAQAQSRRQAAAAQAQSRRRAAAAQTQSRRQAAVQVRSKSQAAAALRSAQRISQTIIGEDGGEMMLIPGGRFRMGSNSSDAGSDEQPVHTVHVDAFYMDKYEVTNAQYKKFIDENPQWQKERISQTHSSIWYLDHWDGNNYPVGKDNHPVINVSWYAAMAYAKWAGKRLPTEVEWEKAARGGLANSKYPWGNSIDSSKANYSKQYALDYPKLPTSAVGRYPPNGYGLYDMAGNVWEWCLDVYDSDSYTSFSSGDSISQDIAKNVMLNFMKVDSKVPRVLRGGSWVSQSEHLRVADRYRSKPQHGNRNIGFRCARSVTP